MECQVCAQAALPPRVGVSEEGQRSPAAPPPLSCLPPTDPASKACGLPPTPPALFLTAFPAAAGDYNLQASGRAAARHQFSSVPRSFCSDARQRCRNCKAGRLPNPTTTASLALRSRRLFHSRNCCLPAPLQLLDELEKGTGLTGRWCCNELNAGAVWGSGATAQLGYQLAVGVCRQQICSGAAEGKPWRASSQLTTHQHVDATLLRVPQVMRPTVMRGPRAWAAAW